MPLPQVSDRIKELPGQALRAVFACVGQLLLAADKLRAQLAGPAEEPAPPPAAPSSPAAAAPAAASGPATAPAANRGDARWRSLDKTGNVRLLPEGGEDQAGAPGTPPARPDDLAESTPAAEPTPAGSTVAEAAGAAGVAVPAPAEPAVPTPAEPAVRTPAEPAVPSPAEVARPAPAEPVPAEPTMAATPAPAEVTPSAEPAPAEPAAGPAPAGPAAEAALPVAGYDQATVASLRARLRVLDVAQVQTLLDYEKAHQSRPDVVTMFERRIAKLKQGG